MDFGHIYGSFHPTFCYQKSVKNTIITIMCLLCFVIQYIIVYSKEINSIVRILYVLIVEHPYPQVIRLYRKGQERT